MCREIVAWLVWSNLAGYLLGTSKNPVILA